MVATVPEEQPEAEEEEVEEELTALAQNLTQCGIVSGSYVARPAKCGGIPTFQCRCPTMFQYNQKHLLGAHQLGARLKKGAS